MTDLTTLLLFLPLIFLLWLARIADRRRRATPPRRDVAALVYALLAMLWGIVSIGGIFAILMGIAYNRYADIDALMAGYQAQGQDPEAVVAMMVSLPRVGGGLLLLALLGLMLLLPPVRRRLARWIPIRAESVTHAVALAYSNLILINLWLIIGVGMKTVAGMMDATPEVPSGQMIALLWLQNGLLMLMALVGVGWLSQRSWRQAWRRLGVSWHGWRDVGCGVGLGLLMFLLLFPLTMLLEKAGVGLDPSIQTVTDKLVGPLLTSLPGVISLGVAAALGEELVYRGALQPRFGILLTAALFALTHSQYGVSAATLVVFLLGLVLGWTRRRYNTTTAIFLHATYNIAIGLGSLLVHLP